MAIKERVPKDLLRRLRRVRLLVSDVDGVLTDGGIYFGERGEIMKRFNAKDGMGIRLLLEGGWKVALLTEKAGPIVQRRAEALHIPYVLMGVMDKAKELERFLKRLGLEFSQVAYVADDVNDLGPLRRVGLPVAVADATEPVLRAARWITRKPGGAGAVREVCDALLASRNR